MAKSKSIQTNFSLRLSDSSKPVLIGDDRIASALDGDKNFYSITYTVDRIGTYLGNITEFLAVKCESPILIEWQRVDMEIASQVYCNSLFINHGDLGKVTLRVPPECKPVIATVWYHTDSDMLALDKYITVYKNSDAKKPQQLGLRNLTGSTLCVPIEENLTYKGVAEVTNVIPALTHTQIRNDLPVHKNK